jgi:hypothetical protein
VDKDFFKNNNKNKRFGRVMLEGGLKKSSLSSLKCELTFKIAIKITNKLKFKSKIMFVLWVFK